MLYMNSMIQEKTGVSACEILHGRNPNLPSDISFTPVTSLSDDREGYVKQLKRDLKDIRQKLSRVLGQNMDQSVNPFSVGDQVIIALLPHENANKLMAKWKGPFTVTKIPNRFQIEYLENNVTRLTHISYAKKYNERCHTAQVGMPRPQRVSKRQPWVRMARLRLIAGSGRHKARMVASSLKAIQDNWGMTSGRIRLQVLGEINDLPPGLRAIVDAAGPDLHIGCDAPNKEEELPMAMESSPTDSPRTTAQVRRYSWRRYDRNEVSDVRREFVGKNKQINNGSSFPFQQAPLVSRVHLLKVVDGIRKRERSRGKQLSGCRFKEPHLSDSREMTSLLLPGQKADEREPHSSLMLKGTDNSEIGLSNRKHPYINHNNTLKGSKTNKKEQECQFKLPGSTNYDVMNDATLNGDVTRPNVNKDIARTHYTPKHLYVSKVKYNKSSFSMYYRTVIRITLLLALIISIVGGLFNIKLPERKSTIGNSFVPRDSCEF